MGKYKDLVTVVSRGDGYWVECLAVEVGLSSREFIDEENRAQLQHNYVYHLN